MLPIEQIIPDLKQQLTSGNAIVVAPPGAGKSTFLPLSLLGLSRLTEQKIILLQPRRIAVRNIASYLAEQLGEPVGKTVGYRIRGESKVSRETKLEIVTEGILTRMLQNHPELEDVGLVIFDEFHERNIHADFSLALCIEVQQALRDDLRLLVMSATLDTVSLQKLMPEAKILQSEGKSYPVEIVYKPDNSALMLHQKISRLIVDVFPKHQGDALVFLPGVSDIHKTAESLGQYFSEEVQICKLFSELSKKDQQLALFPLPKQRRKIVLATNIAETSLTIEGIELVIDSGLEKTAMFQLSKGITHLQSQKISQASATQRAGRAGRLGPGVCYRLWSQEQHQRLASQSVPEILRSDMSGHILEAAIWGTQLNKLALIDQPTDAQMAQGVDSLVAQGLMDSDRKLKPLAKQVNQLGCHPSVANMLLRSADISEAHQSLACALVALFESKDPLGHSAGILVSQRIAYIESHSSHTIWRAIHYWHKKIGCKLTPWPLDDIAVLITLAFPLWMANKKHTSHYLMANGSGCKLHNSEGAVEDDWLAIGKMVSSEHSNGEPIVKLAEPISLAQIEQFYSALIGQRNWVFWDKHGETIKAESLTCLGAIVMTKRALPKPPQNEAEAIWHEVISQRGVMRLPFDDKALQLIQRLRLAKTVMPNLSWFDTSAESLQKNIQQWLMPYLNGVYSWQQLAKLDYTKILAATLDWELQSKLDALLPEGMKVPSGRTMKLNYADSGQVSLEVKMQEMYGLADTPTLAGGKVKVNIVMLSPAGRMLQTTQDLAGFWQGSYKDVQKEMKGRYQKHFWPDDPANALATTRTKNKMLKAR